MVPWILQQSPQFNRLGVSETLLCDAAIGNVQEKAMIEYLAPSSEVVLYCEIEIFRSELFLLLIFYFFSLLLSYIW